MSAALHAAPLPDLRAAVAAASSAAALDPILAALGARKGHHAAELHRATVRRAAAFKAHETRRRLAATAAAPVPAPIPTPERATAPSRPPKPGKRPLSLFAFLAKHGGIMDQGGELRALDLRRVFIPGKGPLVRRSGLPLDAARALAQEWGYIGLPDQDGHGQYSTTISDLLDALSGEARGVPCYPSSYVPPAAEADPAREEHDMHLAEALAATHWRELVEIADQQGSGAAWQFIVHRAGLDTHAPF